MPTICLYLVAIFFLSFFLFFANVVNKKGNDYIYLFTYLSRWL